MKKNIFVLRPIIRIANFFLFGIFLLMSLVCKAQDTKALQWDAAIRWRSELWDGVNALNYGSTNPESAGRLHDFVLLQRVIFGAVWQTKSVGKFVFHLYDARAFGWSLSHKKNKELFKLYPKQNTDIFYVMNPNEEFFEIYDAYWTLANHNNTLKTTLGRQKIAFGDNRIFGPGEWGNTGRWTWDALRIHARFNRHTIDFFAGGTKTHHPTQVALPFTQLEYTGAGVYASLKTSEYYTFEPFYAFKTKGTAPYARDRKLSMHWLGFRTPFILTKNFEFDITAVVQAGSKSQKPVRAFATAFKVSRKMNNLPAKPVLALRHSYASGGEGSNGVSHNFDPAYGARDCYYGLMNLLSWSNIDDKEVILSLNPEKSTLLELSWHV